MKGPAQLRPITRRTRRRLRSDAAGSADGIAADREQRLLGGRLVRIDHSILWSGFVVLPLRLRLIRDGRHSLSAIVGHTVYSWVYFSGMAMMREQNSTL